jgi:hypothetical protein
VLFNNQNLTRNSDIWATGDDCVEARGASAGNQARGVIRQAAGTYAGNWQISASGTANNPIVLRRVNSLDSNGCGYQKVSLNQLATYDLLRPFRPFVSPTAGVRIEWVSIPPSPPYISALNTIT